MGWGQILAQGVKGWQQGTQFREDSERQKEDDAYRTELRGRQRKEWSDADGLKADLKTAAAPAIVVPGAPATLPEGMDARDIGQPGEPAVAAAVPFKVGGQNFNDSATANAAAAAMNDPAAIAGRQAQVYQQRGMPTEATALESKQAALQKQALELKKSGVLDGVAALRQGNKDQAIKALKGSGMFNIDGDVTMEPEDVDIPGVGKVKSYNLKFNTKNPDGTVAPMTLNSHVLAMGMLPYEKQLDLMRRGSDSEAKNDIAAQRLGLAADKVEIAGKLAEARITKMQSGGGGGKGGGDGKSDREYRLILQNQQSNVSREIREVDSAIKELNKDAIPGRPASPQMQELVRQRSALVQRRGALDDEFLGMAEKRAGKDNPNIEAQRSAKPPKTEKTARGELPKIENKAQYDKLPSGAVYIAPDGSTKTKK